MGHISTLKRLVLHPRTIDVDDEGEYFEDDMDGDVNWNRELADLLVRANFDVIGICNPPGFLVSVPKEKSSGTCSANFSIKQTHLAPIASQIKCKVLHLRRSGDMLGRDSDPFRVTPEEVESFAEWAFGPKGLPELEVFAHGDFSHQGLYADSNTLFCRTGAPGSSTPSFQPLTPSNAPLWSLVESHMDALGSCAFKNIMDSS
jgi:hypothetical protein